MVYRTRWPTNGNGLNWNIELRDLATGVRRLVSQSTNSTSTPLPVTGKCFTPRITDDARYIVYQSYARDLVPRDSNWYVGDVFVYDVRRWTNFLATMNVTKTGSANNHSGKTILSGDGATVLFYSGASDLVAGDMNQTRDMFLLPLGIPDTDRDGMDDDFELTYFHTLARDGTGDFDGDGQSDWAEFIAGTDPTNPQSVFRIQRLRFFSTNYVELTFSSVPGKRYQVLAKSNLDDPNWLADAFVLTANSSNSVVYVTRLAQRFYRVLTIQ